MYPLIKHALGELRLARAANDASGTARTERRLNALLDQLAKRRPIPNEGSGTVTP